MNTWTRKALAVTAVALLSVPSAIGVQHALEPTRGTIASWLAAAGFESVYLSTALLILNGHLRVYAQRVALAAVSTAILLNVIADYAMRVPDGLSNGKAFMATFDWLSLLLSVVESLPLAALAYAMATLLHRLSEVEAQDPDANTVVDTVTTALEAQSTQYDQMIEGLTARIEALETMPTDANQEVAYRCPHCGIELPNKQAKASAVSHGHCRHCKPVETNGNGNGHQQESVAEMEVLA
jgi:hypothetical protein